MEVINGVYMERRVSFHQAEDERGAKRWRLHSCPHMGAIELLPLYDTQYGHWQNRGRRVREAAFVDGDLVFAGVSMDTEEPEYATRVRVEDSRSGFKIFWMFNPRRPYLVQLKNPSGAVTMATDRWMFNNETWFLAQLRRINAMLTRNKLTDEELLIKE